MFRIRELKRQHILARFQFELRFRLTSSEMPIHIIIRYHNSLRIPRPHVYQNVMVPGSINEALRYGPDLHALDSHFNIYRTFDGGAIGRFNKEDSRGHRLFRPLCRAAER